MSNVYSIKAAAEAKNNKAVNDKARKILAGTIGTAYYVACASLGTVTGSLINKAPIPLLPKLALTGVVAAANGIIAYKRR